MISKGDADDQLRELLHFAKQIAKAYMSTYTSSIHVLLAIYEQEKYSDVKEKLVIMGIGRKEIDSFIKANYQADPLASHRLSQTILLTIERIDYDIVDSNIVSEFISLLTIEKDNDLIRLLDHLKIQRSFFCRLMRLKSMERLADMDKIDWSQARHIDE